MINSFNKPFNQFRKIPAIEPKNESVFARTIR